MKARIVQKTKNYCIDLVEFQCLYCGMRYKKYTPANYEIVCFESDNKSFFLHTYGTYGYLDLLSRFNTKWKAEKEITKSEVNKLENRLSNMLSCQCHLQSLSCPVCESNNYKVLQRNMKNDYLVNWLIIDEV